MHVSLRLHKKIESLDETISVITMMVFNRNGNISRDLTQEIETTNLNSQERQTTSILLTRNTLLLEFRFVVSIYCVQVPAYVSVSVEHDHIKPLYLTQDYLLQRTRRFGELGGKQWKVL